jgi:hypothetical protein
MRIDNLPKKFEPIWKKALPLLKNGRPGDDEHAKETTEIVVKYKGKLKINKDVLIPVAMMHDIGHSAILPEHFAHITGPNKISNGKLVHMLAGAKIAKGILDSVKYDQKKSQEIVDIISTHDFDQLKGMDWKNVYNSVNKKAFHDIDALDRYTEKRIKNMASIYSNRQELVDMIGKMLGLFFYDEFRKQAENGMVKLKRK